MRSANAQHQSRQIENAMSDDNTKHTHPRQKCGIFQDWYFPFIHSIWIEMPQLATGMYIYKKSSSSSTSALLPFDFNSNGNSFISDNFAKSLSLIRLHKPHFPYLQPHVQWTLFNLNLCDFESVGAFLISLRNAYLQLKPERALAQTPFATLQRRWLGVCVRAMCTIPTEPRKMSNQMEIRRNIIDKVLHWELCMCGIYLFGRSDDRSHDTLSAYMPSEIAYLPC